MLSRTLDLVKTLQNELSSEKLEKTIDTLTETGRLQELLDLLGHEELAHEDYNPFIHGKIAVVGGTNTNKQHLQGISKELGFNKNRFEFFLSYDDMKTFRFDKLRNIQKYAAIIAGPMPHSTTGTGTYSSAIAAMEKDDNYPPVFRLKKITHSSFRTTVKYLVEQNVGAV